MKARSGVVLVSKVILTKLYKQSMQDAHECRFCEDVFNSVNPEGNLFGDV